jgi:fumarate hydratase subunit beta
MEDSMLVNLATPISKQMILDLSVGDQISITGKIYTGRDAALPRLVRTITQGGLASLGLDLEGAIIIHSAVSVAGIGVTTSGKVEIEESIPVLSQFGVRIHIGKGSLSEKTVDALKKHGSIFVVTPPVSALLTSLIVTKRVVAFAEEGMEAIHELTVKSFPAIVAIAHGKSIYA